MATLFSMADQFKDLVEMQEEGIDVLEHIEGLEMAMTEKIDNTLKVIAQFEMEAGKLKETEENLAARRKAKENEAKRLREYIAVQMEKAKLKKVEGEVHTVSVRKTESIQIDAMAVIPTQYMVEKPAPPPAPDKVALKKAIKAGETFEGVELVSKPSITIK